MTEQLTPVSQQLPLEPVTGQSEEALKSQPQSGGFYLGRTIIFLQDATSKTVLVFMHTIRALAIEPLLESIHEFISTIRSSLSKTTTLIFADTFVEFSDDVKNPSPIWKTFDATVRFRNAKLHNKLAAIATRALRIPKKLQTEAPQVSTIHFGAGISNGGNTCFIAPMLQCLRFIPTLRAKLAAEDTEKFPLAVELKKFFDIMEGRNGHEKRAILPHEIAHFRRLAIKLGWPEKRDEFSEEDPRAFCQFLFEHLGFPMFQQPVKVEHTLGFPVRSMEAPGEKERCTTTNNILLSFGVSKEPRTLDQLLNSNQITEDVDKEAIKHTFDSTEHKEKYTPSQIEEHKRNLEAVQGNETITNQTIQLYLNDIPQILPIALKRYGYEKTLNQNFKPQNRVAPSEVLDISLADHPGAKARYKLVSMTVHDGESIDSGHHRAYVPAQSARGTSYVGFNDSSSYVDFDKTQVEEDIAKNGYLFFYEFVGVVAG